MLRNISAVLAVLAMGASANAALMLQSSAGTVLSNGFTSYTISAIGTASEDINTIQDPIIQGKGTGVGPHEVWVPASNGHTPLVSDQTPGLWNAAYTPYDTFFLPALANYLAAGPVWDETNNGATTATLNLPQFAGSSPSSGFGIYGGQSGSAKTLTVGDGPNVPLFQVVLKTGDQATMNVLLFANGGAVSQQITGFTIGAAIPEPATCSLIGLALAGGLGFARRRS